MNDSKRIRRNSININHKLNRFLIDFLPHLVFLPDVFKMETLHAAHKDGKFYFNFNFFLFLQKISVVAKPA